MSRSPYQFKDNYIKCPLCSKTFTGPRILPCLHSFCLTCLETYVKEGSKDGRYDKSTVDKKTKNSSPVNQSTGSKSANTSPTDQNNLPDAKSRPTGSKTANTNSSPTGQGNIADGKSRLSPTKAKSPTKSKSPMRQVPKTSRDPIDRASSKSGNVQFQGTSKGFPCPCCKKFTTTPQLPKTSPDKWAELFPENNLLADLVDLHSMKVGTKVCDPCKRNKSTSQVHSYCKSCRDAMCEPCAKTHKGLRSCRYHKVLTTAQFADAINSLKVEEELCNDHDGKLKEHYCYVHSTLCCSQCLTENHRKCDRVVTVAEAALKSKTSGNISSLENALDKYKSHMDIVHKDRSNLLKKLDNKKSKLMGEFVNVKKHIISQLEKMEKDLNTILDSTHRQETKKIKQDITKCKEIQSAVTNTNEILSVADNHGSNSQIIEMTEKVRGECEYYEESISILCSRMRTVDYDIALDNSLQQVMKRLNQFGRIDVNTTATKLPPAPKLAATLGLQSSTTKTKAVKPEFTLSGKNANEIGEFCARFEEDTQDCWFTGAKFLSDGRILLADRTNRKLKLFTSNFMPIREFPLSSKPWDIALVTDKEFAVSLPAECRIQLISVDGDYLTQTRSIPTDEPCFGICYTDGKFLTVTYDGDPPNLKILSPTGQELTYVCVDDDGFTLFSKPLYVTCTPKAEQIWVSDDRLGCIVNLKETGELNFNYSAIDLGSAGGITLDQEGNKYVCGTTSNSVHVISPCGKRVKVLVTGESISYPRAVAYEPREKKLLVTQGDKDIVKVFSLA